MKLSVESFAVAQKLGDKGAFDAIKQSGFDAVDYSYYWRGEDEKKLFGDNYLDYAKELRSYLDEIGLECSQAHAPFPAPFLDVFTEENVQYRNIVRSIESASLLGAKNIVVHAASLDGKKLLEEYNIKFYKSLIPYCEKFNIRVAVENLFVYDSKRRYHRGIFGTAEELKNVIGKIGSPYIVGCIDIGHAALTAGEPEDFIKKSDFSQIKTLHIQDTDYLSDMHMLPFLGKLNFSNIMSALKQVNYDGDLTFEIFKFLSLFPNELIPNALKFACDTGRYLISLYEKA